MKRNVYTLICSLLLPFFITAQDFPTFGILSSEELALKECPFDKEASAVVLLDEAVATDDDEYRLIETRHVRIKILKESGFEHADIQIPYYRKDNKQYVSNMEATVTNVLENGSVEITKVDKKSFYQKNRNEYWGDVIFTFPKIKVGSIIEYKYRRVSDSYSFLDDWNFNDYLPVVKSTFRLYVPPRLEFAYQVSIQEDLPVVIKNDKSNGTVYFEMNNIPGLDDESYMDARKDYIQKITFQLSAVNNRVSGYRKTNSTWQEVITSFQTSSNFGTQLKKNLAGTAAFIDEVKKMPLESAKIKAIYKYVSDNMSWNGFNSNGTDGIKDAWNKKTGTNGEINLILVNLLRDADLDAYPLLVSERWHGTVKTNYPFIDQFNTAYAYTEAGGKKYYLDAARKSTPADMVPARVLNTTGLVIDRKKGGLITIASNDLSYSEYVNVMIDLDKNGQMKGEAMVKSDGYARVEKLNFLKDKGEARFTENFYQNDDFTVDSVKYLNKDNDSLALEQHLKISGKLKEAAGGYYYLPVNNFLGFQKNPFVSQKRFSNINFGYKRKINTYCSIQLPAEYIPDELPKAVRMVTPDKDITFMRTVEYNKEENNITVMYVFDFTKSTYESGEYGILQQVYKKMFDFLKEPLVLKKK